MKSNKTLWLAREFLGRSVFHLCAGEPKVAYGGFITWDTESLASFCSGQWLSLTGIRLRRGFCRRVKITRSKTGFSFRMVGKQKRMQEATP